MEVLNFNYNSQAHKYYDKITWEMVARGETTEIGTGKSIRYTVDEEYEDEHVIFVAYIDEKDKNRYPQQKIECFVVKEAPKDLQVYAVKGTENASVGETVEFEVTEYNVEKPTQSQKDTTKWDIKIGDADKKVFTDENGDPYRGDRISFVVLEEWAGKEVCVMAYCHSSTEKISQKVTVAELTPEQQDGIRNFRHFTFRTQGVFHEQLKRILRSNRVIAHLLRFFERGIVRMTFDAKELREGVGAHMNPISQGMYHIVFNTRFIGNNGWKVSRIANCNVEYDWSNVRTEDQVLVIILAHEALHARHQAIYEMALRVAQNDGHTGNARILPAVNWLRMEGFSLDFINIWFVLNGNRWEFRRDGRRNERMDNYIRDHNHITLDRALNEFKNDFPGR